MTSPARARRNAGAPARSLPPKRTAPGARDTSRYRAQRRGFPRPVRADQAHHLAGADFQVDAFHGTDPAVADFQAADFEQAHAAAVPRYASMTFGSRCTSAGKPSAMRSPWSSTSTRLHT